ncbi:hypothetical protein N7540_002298 [Penicillium herquei]|nr:hypothetical protein N7540_002298 [Penicillium herquei]
MSCSEPSIPTSEYSLQTRSRLFSLPPEIRYEIFSLAVVGTRGAAKSVDQNTYYGRPGYETVPCTFTGLLRTCKRIYMETWSMPLLLSEHAFCLSSDGRSPKGTLSVPTMQKGLDLIHKRHGEIKGGKVRIFSQVKALEATNDCDGVLKMPNFHPTTVTLTVRYLDTRNWEWNEELNIDGAWCGRVELPASVTKFNIEIECLEHRKSEVDYIINGISTSWNFRRSDGVTLETDKDHITISRWTGGSILPGRWRQIRDEKRPGYLDYYVGKVTWRASKNPPTDERPSNPALRVTRERPVYTGPSIDAIMSSINFGGHHYLDHYRQENVASLQMATYGPAFMLQGQYWG